MPGRQDIVLARFPFTDQSGAKLRPVLTLAELPGSHNDLIVLFITSQLDQATHGLDLILRPSDPAFRGSGLKVASAFRVGKIASMSAALIVGTLGRLDRATFDEIIGRLTHLLRTGHHPTTG